MIRTGFFIFYVVAMALAACDPARRIEMKNISADTAEVIWRMNTDSIGFNPFVLNNSKELKFVIPPKQSGSIKMSFGMGQWTPAEVENIIKRVESFEIISTAHPLKIESLSQLKNYLLAHRKGAAKIEIVVGQ